MAHYGNTKGCGNQRPGKLECYVSEVDLDPIEHDCLTLARTILLFMGDPSSPLRRVDVQDAAEVFGDGVSKDLICAMTDLFSAIHLIRKSPFVFSNPHCINCSAILTENERRVMLALAATRRGHRSAAAAHVMLVCEGNPDVPVHQDLKRLTWILPPINPRARMKPEHDPIAR
ncbi:MAG: hypothetical protein AAF280_06775 [Pseudomonadota bacterium]